MSRNRAMEPCFRPAPHAAAARESTRLLTRACLAGPVARWCKHRRVHTRGPREPHGQAPRRGPAASVSGSPLRTTSPALRRDDPDFRSRGRGTWQLYSLSSTGCVWVSEIRFWDWSVERPWRASRDGHVRPLWAKRPRGRARPARPRWLLLPADFSGWAANGIRNPCVK